MAPSRPDDTAETEGLLRRAAQGDQEAWGQLLTRHRDRLRRLIALRLDPRLQSRVDPSDVLQEVYLEASARLPDYLRREEALPFFLWLRLTAGQRLAALHRHHLGREMRDAGQEVSLYRGTLPEASSAALAAQLLGHDTRPSEAAARAELKVRLQEALNSMDALDREVLALRHFEQLSTAEVGQVLDITPAAAGKRYVRALKRLRAILQQSPGGGGGLWP
jgi:RNA polymerase sigma-70 factor (ECF subfamily)